MSNHKSLYIYILVIVMLALSGMYYLATTPTYLDTRTESVFVYGTLENPFIRLLTCRCRVAATRATITNYRQDGLNILPDPTGTVNGSVIVVSPTELLALDQYENVPEKYIRTRVTDTNNDEHWVYLQP